MRKEFKEFAFKGNMVDMAVGIIIGGAFGLVLGQPGRRRGEGNKIASSVLSTGDHGGDR